MISQPELISNILRMLERRCGVKGVNARQMNAIIKAANEIADALNQPHQPAKESTGLTAWYASDDTGSSSRYMAYVLGKLAGDPSWRGAENAHPYDPDDFGRCVRMLRAAPNLREHLSAMERCGPVWLKYVEHWAEMERLYDEEFPRGKAPKLYDLMQRLRREAGD